MYFIYVFYRGEVSTSLIHDNTPCTPFCIFYLQFITTNDNTPCIPFVYSYIYKSKAIMHIHILTHTPPLVFLVHLLLTFGGKKNYKNYIHILIWVNLYEVHSYIYTHTFGANKGSQYGIQYGIQYDIIYSIIYSIIYVITHNIYYNICYSLYYIVRS